MEEEDLEDEDDCNIDPSTLIDHKYENRELTELVLDDVHDEVEFMELERICAETAAGRKKVAA